MKLKPALLATVSTIGVLLLGAAIAWQPLIFPVFVLGGVVVWMWWALYENFK